MRKVGQIEVYPIKWRAWSEAKRSLAKLLGSRLVPEALELASRVDESDKDQATGAVTQYIAERMPGLSDELGSILLEAVQSGDELAEVLIRGCTTGIEMDDVAAADLLELAAACVEESDVPTLLEREKNFWGSVFGAATRGMKPAA